MSILVRQVRELATRLPSGLRVATLLYLGIRLPVEVIAAGTLGMLPLGPGATGVPFTEGPSWLKVFLRWDSGWYVSIIQKGYTWADCTVPQVRCAQASISFLPGYPSLVRAGMWTGLSLPTVSFILTHGALLLGIWGVSEFVRLKRGDEPEAQRAAISMLVFPSAFFLSAGYAESLFMAAGTWGLVWLYQGRLLPAACALAFGALTRSQGMLLLGAVCVVLLARREWKVLALIGGVGSLAVGGFLLWQHQSFGDALAFVHARRGWGVFDLSPAESVLRYWRRTVSGELGWVGWLDFASIGALLMSGLLAWRRLGPIEGLFCLLVLAAPLSSGQVWGMTRIVLCAFPMFLLLGQLTVRPTVARLLFSSGFAWLMVSAVRFVNGHFAD